MRHHRLFQSLCAIALFALSAQASPPVSFTGPRVHTLTAEPERVAVDDFNADSIPDFAIARSGAIEIYLRDADGELTAVLPWLDIGSSTQAVVPLDFNEDGIADLGCITRLGNPGLRLFAGNGDGTFSAGGTADVAFPMDLAVADFTGDDHVDLAIALPSKGVALFRGDGTGGLVALPVVSTGGGGSRSLDVGDFDEDGNIDVIVANETTEDVAILLGGGDGTFGLPAITATPGKPYKVRVADLDDDGNLDFVLSMTDAAAPIIAALGNGDGSFGALSTYAPGELLEDFTIDDFDRDGFADVFAAHVLPTAPFKRIMWLRGDGSGGFLPPRAFATERRDQTSITSADVNSDGRPDVVLCQRESTFLRSLSVHLGGGDNALFEVFRAVPGEDPYALAVGDFDANGSADLASANETTSDVSILLNNGSGKLFETALISTAPTPEGIAAGDFDEDGNLDLLVTLGRPTRELVTLLGNGDGTFTTGPSRSVDEEPEGLAVDDLDADGHLDAVVVQPSHHVTVYLGTGSGSFVDGSDLGGSVPSDVAIGRFDGDATLDIAVTDTFSNELVLYAGAGDGTFVVLTRTALPGTPTAMAAGDLDLDGSLDILVTTSDGRLSTLLQNGAGSFFVADIVATGDRPVDVLLADWDEDGLLDAACVNQDSDSVSVYTGNGDGTFRRRTDATAVSSPRVAVSADFDRDGHADLATGLRSDLIYIHRNRTFDGVRCRRGNVDAAGNGPVDVLFVNDFVGEGAERIVRVAQNDPVEIRMEAPPSRPGGPSRFAVYASLQSPTDSRVAALPFRLGHFCRAIPMVESDPPGLKKIWNNIGKPGILGTADLPSSPAPSTLLTLPDGVGVSVRVTLQGLILDTAASNGVAAVTNAVILDSI